MEPATLAAISFGMNALGTGLGFFGQQEKASQNNAAIRRRNAYAQKQRAYGEQIKDFEYKNALKIYAMRQEQSRLEIAEYHDSYKNYFFDEQMKLNDIIDSARLSALQSGIKLSQAQGAVQASSLARGVTGRRAGSGGMLSQNALMAGMEGIQRAKRLAMAEDRADMNIDRAAYKTNLMSQMSVNRIGPRPERAPAAPAAFMESMDPGPSMWGLGAGLLSDAGNAFQVYGSSKAKPVGDININLDGLTQDQTKNNVSKAFGSKGQGNALIEGVSDYFIKQIR